MSKCLVTTLKESVSGNLPKLGELILTNVNTALDGAWVRNIDSTPISIKVSGLNGTKLKARQSTDEVNYLEGSSVRFSTVPLNGASISIDNKYAIYWFSGIYNVDASVANELKYMHITLLGVSFAGKPSLRTIIESIPNVTEWSLYNNKNFYIDCTATDLLTLRNLTSLTSLDITSYAGKDWEDFIGGEFELEDIGKSLPNSLTTLRVTNGVVEGSIEEFVSGLRTNNTSGSLTMYINQQSYTGRKYITFNGTIIASSSSAHTLSWDASTITFDGTTIDA